MRGKLWNAAFVFLVLAGLLAGLGRTLLLPKQMNYYENRYADRAAPLTAAGLLDGSFQDALEAALADQVPLAQALKRGYHLAYSTFQRLTALPLSEGALSDRFLNIGGARLFDGWLCYPYRPLERDREALARKAENYAAAFAAHPDTEFFVYYIEKDTDFNAETGEKSGAFDYLRALLPLDDAHVGCLRIDSFEALRGNYLRTDHHWNYRGADAGYRAALDMLLPGEAPLEPTETVTVGAYSGSKAVGRALAAFSEDFTAYRYAFPEQEVLVNGWPARDYGSRDIFLDGAATDRLTYATFYGNDYGVVTIRTPANAGRGTLLVLGDSFDNAILKLLASHFETLVAVDLRYPKQMPEPFTLGGCLEAYPGAKVLLIGNIGYFNQDAFELEG